MRLLQILFATFLTVGILAEGDNQSSNGDPAPPPPSNVTILPPKNSTTIAPTTPVPTTKASTTTPAPTTPTTKSTTTTPPPTTPTTKPTTPTPPPTTPTTAKPTPTPRPAPIPAPTAGNWSIFDEKANRTCLIVHMAVQLEIDHFSNTNSTLKVNIPSNVTATGSCAVNETIDFNIPNVNVNVSNAKFSFTFGKLNGTKKYALNRVDVYLTLPTSPNSSQVLNFTHEAVEYATPLDNSYKCSRTEDLNLVGETKAVLHLSEVQWQAFANSTDKKFSSALDCESGQTPDVVPIAVGCVLVALIVLVLVGYLFGRRRCQARGYLSIR